MTDQNRDEPVRSEDDAPDLNSDGSDVGEKDIPWGAVDSGLSDDIQSSLDAQGVSGRETTAETGRSEADERD